MPYRRHHTLFSTASPVAKVLFNYAHPYKHPLSSKRARRSYVTSAKPAHLNSSPLTSLASELGITSPAQFRSLSETAPTQATTPLLSPQHGASLHSCHLRVQCYWACAAQCGHQQCPEQATHHAPLWHGFSITLRLLRHYRWDH